MRRFFLAITCALALAQASTLTAACIPRDWCRRNGLTDAQISEIFAKDQNAIVHLTLADWRGMKYQGYRYLNVTNWLDICGATNNFAALSFDLQGKNFKLVDANTTLTATNLSLKAEIERLDAAILDLYDQFTNQVAQTTIYSNLCVIASAQAEAAQAKIQDEIADLESKIEKYEGYKTKYPLLKTIWNAMISDAQARIKVLQALTGSAT